jgi:GDP-D-mannose dehydratase
MKNPVAIIVGGTGQFGVYTSKLLLEKGYKVIVTSRNIKKKNYLKYQIKNLFMSI